MAETIVAARSVTAPAPAWRDTRQIESNEQQYGHRFFDPTENVQQWLLD